MAGVEGMAEGQVGEMGAPNGKSLNVVPKRRTSVGHNDSKTVETLTTDFQPFLKRMGSHLEVMCVSVLLL